MTGQLRRITGGAIWACFTGLCLAQTQIQVTLHPHTEAAGAGTVAVSFGLPLPPGLFRETPAVQVTSGGQEIAAWVEPTGIWRKRPPASMQCAPETNEAAEGSLKGLLIQLEYSFSSTDPVPVTVTMGGERGKQLKSGTDVLSTLRLVKEGTFREADGVKEPLVYATLPAEWLVCSQLIPMSSVAGTHKFLEAYDRGMKNYFPAVINTFNPNPNPAFLVDYKSGPEPWLFDRAQVFFNNYIRTGQVEYLREAHRATWYYLSKLYRQEHCPENVRCEGIFSLKNPDVREYLDSKYSYNESLATLYWLSGRRDLLDLSGVIRRAAISEVLLDVPYTDPARFFTERHYANALLGVVVDIELTGSAEASAQADQAISMLHHMQDNPIEGAPKNGCFNHHVERRDTLSFSPWMSGLMAYSLVRAYQTLGDSRLPEMVARLGQCMQDRALYIPTGEREPKTLMPRYIATSVGPPASLDGDAYSDREHAIDVAGLIAAASYFSQDPVQRDRLAASSAALLRTHNQILDVYTRPVGYPGNGNPLYVASPPRKYTWWNKNTGILGWVLSRSVPRLSTLLANRSSIGGGLSLSPVEVLLAGPAPPGGVEIQLSSSLPGLTELPEKILVPEGEMSASFSLKTKSVAERTAVAVKATQGDIVRELTVDLLPAALAGIALAQQRIGGGATLANNQVVLTAPAPAAGIEVALSSSDGSLAELPATVRIPAGVQSAAFSVASRAVTQPTEVNLTATSGNERATAKLILDLIKLASVTITPASVGAGGKAAGRVLLNGPAPAEGLPVKLASSLPSAVEVPAEVMVAGGETSSPFTVTSKEGAESAVTITASTPLGAVTARVSVAPVTIASRPLVGLSFIGGTANTTSRLVLTGPALAGGVAVRLESQLPDVVTVPESVTVPEGKTEVVFPIQTKSVPERVQVVVRAAYGTASVDSTVTVHPATLSYLTAAPRVLTGSGLLRLGLTGPAPAGGATVRLQASRSGAVHLPETVVVPAGESRLEIPVSRASNAQSGDLVITAFHLDRSTSVTVSIP